MNDRLYSLRSLEILNVLLQKKVVSIIQIKWYIVAKSKSSKMIKWLKNDRLLQKVNSYKMIQLLRKNYLSIYTKYTLYFVAVMLKSKVCQHRNLDHKHPRMTLSIHKQLLKPNQFMEMNEKGKKPDNLKGFCWIFLRYLAKKLVRTKKGILNKNVPLWPLK